MYVSSSVCKFFRLVVPSWRNFPHHKIPKRNFCHSRMYAAAVKGPAKNSKSPARPGGGGADMEPPQQVRHHGDTKGPAKNSMSPARPAGGDVDMEPPQQGRRHGDTKGPSKNSRSPARPAGGGVDMELAQQGRRHGDTKDPSQNSTSTARPSSRGVKFRRQVRHHGDTKGPSKNSKSPARPAGGGGADTELPRQVRHHGDTKSFHLEYIKGDLFSCPRTHSLAHCVSRDFHMGKGIALIFKKKFGGVEKLIGQGRGVGEVAVLQKGEHFIYYLITKAKFNHKPTYDQLYSALECMGSHCKENGVRFLSMPRIGCGLDRLVWEEVEIMLYEIFSEQDMTITVYSI